MTGFVHALAFLTRVPVGRHPRHASDRARSVPWFPIVGALVGASVGGVYSALVPQLPALAAAAVAVAAGMALTGAFHEDGLADAVDGIAGGRDAGDRLRIMKDSRHGTFGVLALVTVFVVRVACTGALDAWNALAALVAAHALGRSGAILLMRWRAAGGGLGTGYAEALGRAHVAAGTLAGAVLAVIAAGSIALVAVLVGVAGALAVGIWARRAVGGVTGDVLGAAEQVAEVAVLAVLTGWAARHGHRLAWWR